MADTTVQLGAGDVVKEAKVAVEAQDAPEGLSESSPRVDPSRANRVAGGNRRGPPRGDPDKALSEAEAKVEATYRTSVQDHVALEPHGSVAEFDAEGGLTLWCSTQAT